MGSMSPGGNTALSADLYSALTGQLFVLLGIALVPRDALAQVNGTAAVSVEAPPPPTAPVPTPASTVTLPCN